MPLKDQHILRYMETFNLNKKCNDDRYKRLLFDLLLVSILVAMFPRLWLPHMIFDTKKV